MKQLILTSIALVFYTLGFSQQVTALKIKDLTVVKDLPNAQSDSSKIVYRIFFKISDSSLAAKVHLLFGSERDSGNIMNEEGTFSTEEGKYYITYNENKNAVTNFTGVISQTILKSAMADIKSLTLYIEDKTNNTTSRLYFDF